MSGAAQPVPNTQINIQGLGNLLAPADGVTHAAIFSVTLNNSVASLSMPSLQTYIGWVFRGQAMAVDNTGGSAPIVVQGTYSQFTETVPAGIKRTFQYPSVSDEILLFSSTGNQTVQVFLYDYPAFPDSNNTAPLGVTSSVNILGQPVQVEEVQLTLAYLAASNTNVGAGATITVFAGGTIVNGGLIKNPTGSGTQILVDAVAAPGATEGGTTYGIDPGGTLLFGPTAIAIQARNPSGGAVNIVAYRF